MKKLMNVLFLSCLKATELIEKKLLFRLSCSERMRLAIHKMMCRACSLYEKQTLLLDEALSSHNEKEEISLDLEKFRKDLADKIEESHTKSGGQKN